MRFVDKHIELDKLPKKFKKMTATRFASVLGLNTWKTPFATWCEMTRTYEEPFTDSIYTIAGKVIEPKIIDYLKERFFLDIETPEDVYGKDYFKKTYGDFYGDVKIFGGMWDAKSDDLIVEIKTTKRAEDWLKDIPIYYKLQAALYAYLSKIDDVIITCSFLKDGDYEDPAVFVPTIDNTIVVEWKMSEDFPDFEKRYIKPAMKFWKDHVETGISPDFDERKDADILKTLRTNVVGVKDDEIEKLLAVIDADQSAYNKASSEIKVIEKRLKENKEKLKKNLQGKFGDNDDRVEIKSTAYIYTLSKNTKSSVDTEKLKQDELYEKYLVEKVEYRMSVKAVNENDSKD